MEYEDGVRTFQGRRYYLLGTFNSDRRLQNINLRIGLGILTPNSQIENRLKVNLLKDQK